MQVETPARRQLVRDAKREALRRMEDAARTAGDFEKVVEQWNHLDTNKRRRWNRWEVGRPNAEMLHWDKKDANDERGKIKDRVDTVIPPPLGHAWWRQLLRGDFLDLIHDCPHEMHELTSSLPISDLLQTLNENQKEVLYYWAIRQETPQQIAKRRNQTDRNILKVYATLIGGLRRKLYESLRPRYCEGLPLTAAQQRFMADYEAGRLKTRKTKAIVDDGNNS